MAAAKKPLEFHAKNPWQPQEAVEDPDDEEEGDETGNGFSLEEVLRLGGTKVKASEKQWGRVSVAHGLPIWKATCTRS